MADTKNIAILPPIKPQFKNRKKRINVSKQSLKILPKTYFFYLWKKPQMKNSLLTVFA